MRTGAATGAVSACAGLGPGAIGWAAAGPAPPGLTAAGVVGAGKGLPGAAGTAGAATAGAVPGGLATTGANGVAAGLAAFGEGTAGSGLPPGTAVAPAAGAVARGLTTGRRGRRGWTGSVWRRGYRQGLAAWDVWRCNGGRRRGRQGLPARNRRGLRARRWKGGGGWIACRWRDRKRLESLARGRLGPRFLQDSLARAPQQLARPARRQAVCLQPRPVADAGPSAEEA
jgi:hypothetical protein